MKELKMKLDKKANFRSKALIALGSTVFLSQFAFIMGGTYVFYSWDVMEPIAYCMLLSNFTCRFLFYTINKKDMSL